MKKKFTIYVKNHNQSSSCELSFDGESSSCEELSSGEERRKIIFQNGC